MAECLVLIGFANSRLILNHTVRFSTHVLFARHCLARSCHFPQKYVMLNEENKEYQSATNVLLMATRCQ